MRGFAPFIMFEESGGGSGGGSGGSGDGGGGKPPELTPEQKEAAEFAKLTPEQVVDKIRQEQRLRTIAEGESKERRLKLEKFEKEEADRKKAELGELERSQAEAKEANDRATGLQKQLQEMRIRNAVRDEALRMGFADLDDAYRLADLKDVKENEDGKVEGVKDTLEALAKSKPYLLVAKKQEPPPKKPNTDSANRGGNKDGEVDEKALRAKYGL